MPFRFVREILLKKKKKKKFEGEKIVEEKVWKNL